MIFDTVSFDRNDILGTQVDGKTLYIYTHSRTYDIDYATTAKAQDAHKRLVAELYPSDGGSTGKSSTASSFFDKVKAKVQDVVSDKTDILLYQMASDAILSTAKAKAEKMHKDLEDTLGTVTAHLSTRVQSFVDEVVAVLKDEEDTQPKPQATRNDPPKTTKAESTKRFHFGVDDAFGGESSTEAFVDEVHNSFGTPNEPIIEDMTMTQLEAAISAFVDDSVSNPAAADIMEQLVDMVGSARAEEAVATMKHILLETALANPKSTLSQIVGKFFR